MRRFKGAVLALAVSASLSATAYGGESINFGDYTAVLADDGINFFSEYNDIENVGGGYFAALFWYTAKITAADTAWAA